MNRKGFVSARSNATFWSQDQDMRLSLEGSKEPESLNVPHNSVGWLSALSLLVVSTTSSGLPGNFHRATPCRACSLKTNEFGRKKRAPPLTLASRRLSSAHGRIPYCRAQHRGHSSVGRAVALQAIGQGFESPCLHHGRDPGPVAQLVRACA